MSLGFGLEAEGLERREKSHGRRTGSVPAAATTAEGGVPHDPDSPPAAEDMRTYELVYATSTQ